jgi:serine/threonine protein phosphatase PrpC
MTFDALVDLEVAENKGEDANLRETYKQTEIYLIGVFDGLGGRSAGYGGQTGGRIASKRASEISKEFFKQWNGKITSDNAIQLQDKICQALKKDADDHNMRTTSSRLKGSLVEHKLCTTIALASIPKQQTTGNSFKVDLAWMGDSRIYFLSPTNGLQQLTKDDLVTPKDAFEMLRQDPPMSQYLTADINPKWQIHFQSHTFQEQGCFLACTDGCFQYFSAPWEFERLLLETLSNSKGTTKETNTWEKLIEQKYTEIKQDDVSLIIYPVGFQKTSDIKDVYQNRLGYLQENFISDTNNYDELKNIWEKYKPDYEHYLPSIQDGPPISSAITTTNFRKITEDRNKGVESNVKILLNKAESCCKNSQFEEGEKLCKQVLKLQPYNIAAKHLLGVIYYELAKRTCDHQEKTELLDLAASRIEEVIEHNQESENVEAYYQILGKIYYELKDWEKANKYNQSLTPHQNNS